MASSLKPQGRTYTAGGAINPHSFVKYSTSSPASSKNPYVVQCSAGDSPMGIADIDSAAASGDSVEVAMLGGARLTLGSASGTVSPGQSMKSDGSGYGVPTSGAGDRCGAQAEEGGVAGDIIGVTLNRFEKHNADAT